MGYSSIETLTIHGTSAVNDFVVSSNSANLTLNGNNGNDRLFMGGAAQNLDGITGNVTFNAGAGTDSVELRDQQNAANDTYSITQTTFDRTDFALLSHSSAESLLLEGGTGDNAFNVQNSLSTMPLTLRGNSGADNFVLGNLAVVEPLDALTTIDGGAGVDNLSIIDTDYTGTAGFSVSAVGILRSGMGDITYSTLEAMTINAGTITGTGNKTHQVHALPAATTLTLNSGNGSDTIHVSPTSHNLTNIASNLTINGQNGTDVLILSDLNNAAAETYTFVSNTVQRTGGATISFGTLVETLTFNGGPGNATFVIRGVSVNTPLTLNMGGGDDAASIGSAANLLNSFGGAITLDAGAGNDSVNLIDSGGAFDANYNVTSSTVARSVAGGFAGLTFSQLESLTVNATQTANVVTVQSLASTTALVVNGNSGTDTFNLGDATNHVEPLDGPMTLNGGVGTDTINFNDSAEVFAFGFTVNSTTVSRTGMGQVTYGTAEQLNIFSGGGIGKLHTVNGTAATTPVLIDPGSAADTINVVETATTAPVTVEPSTGFDTVNVNTDGAGSARVVFDESITLATLNIGVGGMATMLAEGSRVLRTVNLTVNGTFDLTNNNLIVDYSGASPLSTIAARLTSGHNNGAWNGNGINSSTAAATPNHALGYAESSAIFPAFPASFAGQQVDNTCVLVTYTRYGDANLDRNVNLADFNRVAGNFGAGTLWSNGNFNFDGGINLLDFNLLAANFGQA
jgi:hypothetical protein